jgi:hypothetical protein
MDDLHKKRIELIPILERINRKRLHLPEVFTIAHIAPLTALVPHDNFPNGSPWDYAVRSYPIEKMKTIMCGLDLKCCSKDHISKYSHPDNADKQIFCEHH